MIDHLDLHDEIWISEVVDAIGESRIRIAAQGVHPIVRLERRLYDECFARLVDREGRMHSAGMFVPVLEAWSRTPLLDRHVLKLVLDALEADPAASLGCNISADSFACEADWLPIRGQLESRPHLTGRLVLEITETRPLGNIVSLKARMAEARRLGCRIAVDDFGCGNIAPSQLLTLDVDIVKIDAVFVRNIRQSGGGGNSLRHMVGLAACVSPFVVVEGVETSAQLEAAMAAGATHVQGYLLSKPLALPRPGPAIWTMEGPG